MAERDVRDEPASRPSAPGIAEPRSAASPGPSPELSVSEFLDLLDRSQLVRSRQLAAMRTRALADKRLSAREFAVSLVESGHLTRWQAERLLARKAGFQLGKYRLVDRIGVGGMAVVLKAKQSGLNRTVAIKVLARTLLKRSDAVRRFFREIEAASSLDHPNIVRAIDSNCIDGVPFLVMEYVEGRDLHSLIIQRGPLSVAWACEFCRQAALGLQHAYEQGVVHRDIKPANLLVTRRSPAEPLTVKILDFGLARFASDTPDAGALTAAHQIFGTVDFISPEQARSARSADTRSDIFSLGCTLFYLLTGKPPFRGETAMEKLTARIADAPIPLRELCPNAPPELVAVVDRMLARDPAERFQTPKEVAEALQPFGRAATDGAEETSLTRRAEDRLGGSAATSESEMALENFLGQLSDPSPVSPESGDSVPVLRRRAFPTKLVIILLILALFAAVVGLKLPRWTRPPAESNVDAEASEAGDERAKSAVLPLWPGESPDLLVAWQAGMEKNLTGHEDSVVWGLKLDGKVSFDAGGQLALQGGSVVLHGPETRFVRACQESGEFTVEIVINSSDRSAGRRAIVSMSDRRKPENFSIAIAKGQLVARVRTSQGDEKSQRGDVDLCRMPIGTARHLIVSYRDGQLVCYLDGEKISERDDIRGALTAWEHSPLAIGAVQKGDAAFRGTVERFAFLTRFCTLEAARIRFQMAEAARAPQSR